MYAVLWLFLRSIFRHRWTHDGYRYWTEPKIIPKIRYRDAIPKLVKKRVRYRYYTDTEIPENGISVLNFVLPLSECPRTTAYSNTYGLKVNHYGPPLTTYHRAFYRLRTSCISILTQIIFLSVLGWHLPGLSEVPAWAPPPSSTCWTFPAFLCFLYFCNAVFSFSLYAVPHVSSVPSCTRAWFSSSNSTTNRNTATP